MKRYAQKMLNHNYYSTVTLSGQGATPVGYSMTIDPILIYAPYVSLQSLATHFTDLVPEGSKLLGPYKFENTSNWIDDSVIPATNKVIGVIGVRSGRITHQIDAPGIEILFAVQIYKKEKNLASTVKLTEIVLMSEDRWWQFGTKNETRDMGIKLSHHDHDLISLAIQRYVEG